MILNFKTKVILIAVAIIVVLCSTIAIMGYSLSEKRNTIQRLNSNQKALFSELEQVKTNDSINAFRVKELTLTLSELKEQKSDLSKEIKNLKIKLRDVENVTKIQQSQLYEFRTKERDSVIVILHDTIREEKKIHVSSYADRWINFSKIDDNVKIETYDSITIVKHCRTRKFLWWVCKKYTGEVTIKNYNPYSKVQNITTIEIEQKRKRK